MKDKHTGKTQISRDADKTIQVLFEISNALNSTLRIDELYRSIHRSLGKIVNVDNFYIALYHEKTDSITFPYYIDEVGDLYEEIEDVSQAGIKAGEVIRTKRPLLITKSETIERQKEIGKKGLGVVSEQWLGVPLEIKQKVKPLIKPFSKFPMPLIKPLVWGSSASIFMHRLKKYYISSIFLWPYTINLRI